MTLTIQAMPQIHPQLGLEIDLQTQGAVCMSIRRTRCAASA